MDLSARNIQCLCVSYEKITRCDRKRNVLCTLTYVLNAKLHISELANLLLFECTDLITG